MWRIQGQVPCCKLPLLSASQACNPTAISLKAGCELFLRYATRTSALEDQNFASAKQRIIQARSYLAPTLVSLDVKMFVDCVLGHSRAEMSMEFLDEISACAEWQLPIHRDCDIARWSSALTLCAAAGEPLCRDQHTGTSNNSGTGGAVHTLWQHRAVSWPQVGRLAVSCRPQSAIANHSWCLSCSLSGHGWLRSARWLRKTVHRYPFCTCTLSHECVKRLHVSGLHCSRVALALLQRAAQQGVRFSVIVTEGRPDETGARSAANKV